MLDFNIVTFHGLNYGATLQAFALKSYLTEMGYSAGVFDYKKTSLGLSNRNLKGRISSFVSLFVRDDDAFNEKCERFTSFQKNYLNLNECGDSKVFLTGSDQVWNAERTLDPTYFLEFADDSCYKASYAASMGKDRIPDEKKKVFKKYIDSLDQISVREEGAKKCLSEIYEGQISVNIDPTLLLQKHFYKNYALPVENLPNSFILVYILHIPKNANKLLNWLKKDLGYDIVLIDSGGAVTRIVKHDYVVNNAGPGEFLWLFMNAKAVVTTSFHGTAFSLIFEREFYSIVNSEMPSRISNIMKLCGLSAIGENQVEFQRTVGVDWKNVNKILEAERLKSRDYLESVYINALHKPLKKLVGNVSQMKDACTGCSACQYICPANAITMSLNKEGFYEPAIDLNMCIKCDKCLNYCPLNKTKIVPKIKTWYGWSNNENIILSSSSGGAFRSIADNVISEHGVIISAVYSKDFRSVLFSDTETVSIEKMQKSKYTVSNPEGIYDKLKDYLDLNRVVLFCGTPCQCAAVEALFDNKYNNLITCDFVCGGMPSLLFYREHLDWLENTFESKIKSIDFRPKDWGWGRYRIKVDFENGQQYIRREYADSYFCCFVNKKLSVREKCYECPFKHYHRSDITIADFWGYGSAGIDKHESGISILVANTEKGKQRIEEINNFELHEIEEKYVRYAFMPKAPIESKLRSRKELFKLAEEKGFEKAANELYDFSSLNHYWQVLKKKVGIFE